jgi:anti-sigma factor RsiW
MMTEHTYVHKRLLLYLDQELASQEQERVQRHLSRCSACQELASSLQSLYQHKSLDQPGLPPSLWPALRSRLQQPRQPLPQGLWRPALSFAVIVICVLFGHFLGSYAVAPVSPVSEEQMIYETFSMNAIEPYAEVSLAGAVRALYSGQ